MVETAFGRIPPGKDTHWCVVPARLLTFWKRSVGITPRGKGRAVGTGAFLKKLQAASAVKESALGERAVSSMSAKSGKIRSRKPPAVENDKGMHMAVGRMVIVDGGNELNRLPIALFELEHRGTG